MTLLASNIILRQCQESNWAKKSLSNDIIIRINDGVTNETVLVLESMTSRWSDRNSYNLLSGAWPVMIVNYVIFAQFWSKY